MPNSLTPARLAELRALLDKFRAAPDGEALGLARTKLQSVVLEHLPALLDAADALAMTTRRPRKLSDNRIAWKLLRAGTDALSGTGTNIGTKWADPSARAAWMAVVAKARELLAPKRGRRNP